MSTLKALRKAASAIGATVEDTRIWDTHECRVEAPKGMVWNEGVHEFVDCAYLPWKPDYDDLLARMSYGFEKCSDPECEWCHPELYE